MRRRSGRVGWSLGDQALSSLTNLALTVAVAREVDIDDFGVFALLMGAYLLVLFAARGVASDPLVSLYAGDDSEELVSRSVDSAGATLVGGFAVSACALTGAALMPWESLTVAAFAVALPGVLLQDHIRFIHFAAGNPRRAFWLDSSWALLQSLGLLAVMLLGIETLPTLILIWGASGTLSGLLGLVLMRMRPRLSGVQSWLRSTGRLWRFYAAENLLTHGTNLLVLFLLAMISGVEATAALRGAVTLYTPLALFAAGAVVAGVPELARLNVRRPEAVLRTSMLLGFTLASVGLVWTVAVVTMPDRIGIQVLGETWAEASDLLIFVGVDTVATLYALGPFVGMRAVGRTQGMATRTVLSAMRLTGSLMGAALAGANGVALAFAIMAPVQVGLWTWVLFRQPNVPNHPISQT